MQRIEPRLYANYQHWSYQMSEYKEDVVPYGISLPEVFKSHYLLCDYFLKEGEAIALPGPRDINLLVSAMDRQSVGFANILKWQDLFHVTATLFFGLVKNHSFHDGNKRTALLSMLYQLEKNGRTVAVKKKEFENLAVRTAAGRLMEYPYFRNFRNKGDAEVRTIAQFLRKNTRQIERGYVRVTYNQLQYILKRYGFEIDGPQANYINIVKKIKVGFWSEKEKVQSIIQVGCPRMTAQINPKALKSILKACSLTADRGYDSQVVFGEADPLSALIGEFEAPLRRLRDR